MSTIDDILNAGDSSDDELDTTRVDLETLLDGSGDDSDDDNDVLQGIINNNYKRSSGNDNINSIHTNEINKSSITTTNDNSYVRSNNQEYDKTLSDELELALRSNSNDNYSFDSDHIKLNNDNDNQHSLDNPSNYFDPTSSLNLNEELELLDLSPLSPTRQSQNQHLNALIAAEKREKRFLLAGSRDIISALQGKRTNKKDDDFLSNITNKSTIEPYTNLRCTDLSTLSSQLKRNSSYKQHGPGIATVLYIVPKFIAVGTSKGLTLLFDHRQEIRQVIGSSVLPANRSTASVTAIDVQLDGSYLITGHSTGEMALWDISKGVLLKRVTELHQQKITRLQFVTTVSEDCTYKGSSSSNSSSLFTISVDSKGIILIIHLFKALFFYQ
jgi:hypothetical protein